MTGRLSGALVGLGAMVVAAGVAVAVAVAVPVDPPAALRTATPAGTVRATERSDADERQVQLALDTGAPRAVVTSMTGTVTAAACSTGQPLRSGDVIAHVDGRAVIALASAVPLWRDLALEDTGDDVRGLQREFDRLGADLAVDGLVGAATLRAARQFLVDRGVPRVGLPKDMLRKDAFAWVPAATNTVRSCTAVIGAPVPVEGVLAELPAELRSARIDAVPVDPVPGDRSLRIGGTEVLVDERGVVSSTEALARIAALPEYAATVASADGVPTLPASWSLRSPRTVQVVPPTALYEIEGDRACVQPTSGAPAEVEVLGSELGQSFVRATDGHALDRLRASPDRTRSCR